MINQNNYYDILLKLRQEKEKLKNFHITSDPTSLTQFELLLLETKALINEYEILQNTYSEKLRNFVKYAKSKEYQNMVDDTWERTTDFIIDLLTERDIDINYIFEKDKSIKQEVYTAHVHYNTYIEVDKNGDFIEGLDINGDKSKKSIYRIFYDIPNLYLYSSVKAISLRKYYDDYIQGDSIHTYSTIKDFYNSVGYLDIFGHKITDIVNLPNNLAYFVSSININNSYLLSDKNVGYFIFTAFTEVLTDLENFVHQCINSPQKQEISSNIKASDTKNKNNRVKKHVIKWENKYGSAIYVDNKRIVDLQNCYIEELQDILKEGKKRIYKQHASKINTVIKKIANTDNKVLIRYKISPTQQQEDKSKNNKFNFCINEDFFDIKYIDYDN